MDNKNGLYYFKKLDIQSPQRCDCISIMKLSDYKQNKLSDEENTKIEYHLNDFKCEYCNKLLKTIGVKGAFETLSNNRTKKLIKRLMNMRKKTVDSDLKNKLKLIDLKNNDRDINFIQEIRPSKIEIGQIWYSDFSSLDQEYPATWPMIITNINNDDTYEICLISPDKIENNKIIYLISDEEYWANGNVEVFYPRTINKSQLRLFKGKIKNMNHIKNIRKMIINKCDINDCNEEFFDWSMREITISQHIN